MQTENQNAKEGYELLYRTSNVELWWHTKAEFLYADWIGVQYEPQLKIAGEKIIGLLGERKCTVMLNDNTRVVGPWSHAADWMRNEWFTRVQHAGLTRVAWILADDLFSQLSAKRALPEGHLVQTFATYQQAFHWIRSINRK